MFSKQTSSKNIYEEAEKFVKNFSSEKCYPPVIIKVFLPIRERAYQNLTEQLKNDKNSNPKDSLKYFIKKFEIEYIDLLKDRIKEGYAAYIQQKKYNIPSDVNLNQLKDFGATSEITQFCTAVAEWSLELEILAYTMEGIKLYEISDFNEVDKKDYVNLLKNGHSYQKKASFQSVGNYMLRKMATFSLGKFSSLVLVRCAAKMRFGIPAIIEIFWAFATTSRVPWAMVLGYLNLPWLIGSVAFSFFIKKVNDYMIQDEVISNLQQVLLVFETNKLELVNERNKITDLMIEIADEMTDMKKSKSREKVKKLNLLVENLLNPVEEIDVDDNISDEEFNKMYNIKEMDDFTIIEDKEHKEEIDDSGVVIIDW